MRAMRDLCALARRHATDARRRVIGLASVVTAGSVLVLAVGVGVGVGSGQIAPQAKDDLGDLMKLTAVGADATGSKGNGLEVVVGKAVDVTTDPAGRVVSKGLYTATTASGTGLSTVKVPVGTARAVDVSAFKGLQADGDSIVYNIKNSGSEVQQSTVTAGQYKADLPVTVDVELKVDGKPVDPNTATSITGDVELNYQLRNNTNRVQEITYKDASGALRTKEQNVAVPFNVSYSGTFGGGWAQLTAPWANSGFSTGQTISGSATLLPSPLNKMNPNGVLTIKGKAFEAALPAVKLTIMPQAVSGTVTSGLDAGTSGLRKVDDLLSGQAIPLLLEVQGGLGDAAGKVSKLLDEKVNPLLDLVSQLHLDPAKANAAIAKGGQQLASLGDLFLGVNRALAGTTANLAEKVDRFTSSEVQAELQAVIDKLDGLETAMGKAIPILRLVAGYLTDVPGYLSMSVATLLGQYSSLAPLICPGSAPDCTVGEVIDAYMVKPLPNMCAPAQSLNALWNGDPTTYDKALTDAAAYERGKGNDDTAKALDALHTNLTKQVAGTIPASCESDATNVAKVMEGTGSALGGLGKDINEIIPLLATLESGAPTVKAGLIRLKGELPDIHRELTRPCSSNSVQDDLSDCGLIKAMQIVAEADADAAVALDETVLKVVKAAQPIVEKLFGIANELGRAAMPLKIQIDKLPGLITQIAYGNLGTFVSGAESLEAFAENLTNVASEIDETYKAIDARFNAGDGFPYGSATGEGVKTAAVYTMYVSAAKKPPASFGGTVVFAGILTLLGLLAAAGTQYRSRRE